MLEGSGLRFRVEVLAGMANPEKKMSEALKWAAENRSLLLGKWEEIIR